MRHARWFVLGIVLAVAVPVIASNLNDAQQGTYGTPSNTNRFVTDQDPRVGGADGGVLSLSVLTPITNTGTASAPIVGIVNKGTTTQVLHGNAAGNAAMGAIVAADLPATAVTAGSYTNTALTVDAAGRLTAASSGTAPVTSVGVVAPLTTTGGATPTLSTSIATSTLVGRTTAGAGVMEAVSVDSSLGLSALTLQRAALTGDVTASAGSNATTLATVASAGTTGDATHVAQVTIDAKGRVTTATAVAITGTAPGGSAGGDLGGTYPNPTVLDITHVNAGTLPVARGGTGAGTETAHGVLLGQGTSAMTATAVGATNTLLHGNTGADPTYSAVVDADVSGTFGVPHGGTGLATLTAHAVQVGNGASAPTQLAVGAANTFLAGVASADPTFRAPVLASADFANQGTTTTLLHGNGSGNPSWGSVVPGDFGTQTANTVLAGPTSGSAATPTFRALGPGDDAAVNAQWFGTGTDGDLTLGASGTTTLTADVYYGTLAWPAGSTATIVTAGYRIYCSVNLNLTNAPAGAITRGGTAGGNGANSGTAGGGVANAASVTVGGGAGNANSSNGGAGGTGAGSGGNSGSSGSPGNGGGGGAGGSGGAAAGLGSSGNSGISGAASSTPTGIVVSVPVRDLLRGATLLLGGAGGGGGSGGGGDGSVSGGGGGAGGGHAGVMYIGARLITTGGSTSASTITAIGGAGGNGGSPASGTSGGGNGGGGSGGGWIYIVYGAKSGSPVSNLVDASGGAGGNGGTGTWSAHNSGGRGGTGGTGGMITLILLGTSSTTTSGGAGSASSAVSGTAGTTGGAGGNQKANL